MNDDQNLIAALILKYIAGEPLTAEENERLGAWRARSEDNRVLPDQYKDKIWVEKQLTERPGVPTEDIWATIVQSTGIEQETIAARRKRVNIPALTAAAVLTALVGIGATYLFGRVLQPVSSVQVSTVNRVSGHYHRLLADGSGLAEDGCVSVTPFDLVLPDGSKVKLACGSTLRHPVRFDGGQRQVWLSGQATFEVSGDKDAPFIVHAGQTAVQVLGTVFNITAYPGDRVSEITLLKGKVTVTYKDSILPLRPSEQAVIDGESIYKRVLEHPAGAVGWSAKDPYMEFDSLNLNDVVHRLARRYNMKVYNPKGVIGASITGIFLLGDPRDANLELLGDAERWKARIERRHDTIFVSPYDPAPAIK